MDIYHVGIIGLGRSGRALATRLAARDYDVIGYDADPAGVSAAAAAGIRTARIPADVAESADAVIVAMPDLFAADEVLFDLGGVGETLRAGAYVIDASVVGPAFSRHATARLARFGIVRIEAWLANDADPDESSVFAAGERLHLRRVLPLLREMARDVTFVGPTGTAAVLRQLAAGLRWSSPALPAAALTSPALPTGAFTGPANPPSPTAGPALEPALVCR